MSQRAEGYMASSARWLLLSCAVQEAGSSLEYGQLDIGLVINASNPFCFLDQET